MPTIIRLFLGASVIAFAVGCSPNPVYHSGHVTRSPKASRSQATPDAPASRNAHPVAIGSISTERAYQLGVASYYGQAFHGRKTANGEIFNMYKLTAAHRVLPLGTMVKVTNLTNGRWVEVKVNDRGPFIEGRILDLSFAAALELEMVKAGTARVMIELVKD
jgi:rare lipoprotein A